MKMKFEESMKKQVLDRIQSLEGEIVLRRDVIDLGSARQVSRALKSLTKEGVLAKLGYGIYAKLSRSSITDDRYLKGGFLSAAREALTKLGIKWEISEAEQNYNEGKTQQVPINPPTILKTRFRRKLSYKNMEICFE